MRPGGVTVVPVEPDDVVTISDRDGGQIAEVTALDPDGRDDPAALGLRADAPARTMRAQMTYRR